MKDLKRQISEDILCSLIYNSNEYKEKWLYLLENEKYEEILDIAVNHMSKDQKVFYDKVTSLENKERFYLLAGLPGTGKSYLQNVLHLQLSLTNPNKFICMAPTNLVAVQQHGITIHKSLNPICNFLRLSSFKIEESLIDLLKECLNKSELRAMSIQELQNAIRNARSFTRFQCKSPDVVLIDEGSMVSSLLLALLICQFNDKTKYIIMYGPNQLSPISGFPSCDAVLLNVDSSYHHLLHTQKRFDEDCAVFSEFVVYANNILSDNEIFSEDKVDYYVKNLAIGGSLQDYHNLTDNDRILIVSTNKQRVEENNKRLTVEGEGPIFEIPAENCDGNLSKKYNIESNLGIEKVLRLRKGVKCIIRCNDLAIGLVKGFLARIDDFFVVDNKVISIQIYNFGTKNYQTLHRRNFEVEDEWGRNDKAKPCSVSQFPLALHYSSTAHSAQGKTLSCHVGVDLINFDPDQYKRAFFVAITRIRDPKQLFMDKHPVYLLDPNMDLRQEEEDLYDNVQNIVNKYFSNHHKK